MPKFRKKPVVIEAVQYGPYARMEFNEENMKKLFKELAPQNLRAIDESDPVPYDRLVQFISGDGILMAAGYRHGRLEIFEMIDQNRKPRQR